MAAAMAVAAVALAMSVSLLEKGDGFLLLPCVLSLPLCGGDSSCRERARYARNQEAPGR